MAEEPAKISVSSEEDIRNYLKNLGAKEEWIEVAVQRFREIMTRVKELPKEEREDYLKKFGMSMDYVQEIDGDNQGKMSNQLDIFADSALMQMALYAVVAILILVIIVFIGRKLFKTTSKKEIPVKKPSLKKSENIKKKKK
ncbi:hypothetical protein DMENIID0001_094920 [Sergentomyia squamirostris]